jgi:hypothetical protein
MAPFQLPFAKLICLAKANYSPAFPKDCVLSYATHTLAGF